MKIMRLILVMMSVCLAAVMAWQWSDRDAEIGPALRIDESEARIQSTDGGDIHSISARPLRRDIAVHLYIVDKLSSQPLSNVAITTDNITTGVSDVNGAVVIEPCDSRTFVAVLPPKLGSRHYPFNITALPTDGVATKRVLSVKAFAGVTVILRGGALPNDSTEFRCVASPFPDIPQDISESLRKRLEVHRTMPDVYHKSLEKFGLKGVSWTVGRTGKIGAPLSIYVPYEGKVHLSTISKGNTPANNVFGVRYGEMKSVVVDVQKHPVVSGVLISHKSHPIKNKTVNVYCKEQFLIGEHIPRAEQEPGGPGFSVIRRRTSNFLSVIATVRVKTDANGAFLANVPFTGKVLVQVFVDGCYRTEVEVDAQGRYESIHDVSLVCVRPTADEKTMTIVGSKGKPIRNAVLKVAQYDHPWDARIPDLRINKSGKFSILWLRGIPAKHLGTVVSGAKKSDSFDFVVSEGKTITVDWNGEK